MKQQWPKRLMMSVLTLVLVGSVLFIPQETSFARQVEQSEEGHRPPPPPRNNRPRRPPRDNANNENNVNNENSANDTNNTNDETSTNEPSDANGTIDADETNDTNDANSTTPLEQELLSQLIPMVENATSVGTAATIAANPASANTTANTAATSVEGRSAFAPTTADILALVALADQAAAEHADQYELLALVQNGEPDRAREEAFETGDELFETRFNALDGVGANVGQGLRFTQIPRADLDGPNEWANHFPKRITGPNAEACNDCHGTPVDDGAGPAANNNVRDPLHTGDMAFFIQRQTPHVFAAGAVQVLAEEMTEALHAVRDQAVATACSTGEPATVALSAKGVDFGTLTVQPTAMQPCTYLVDTTGVSGIDADLIVRPFQWKGVIATIRAFNRDAAHQELGLQSVEIVGDGVDGDGDGVVNELSVGDQTALAVYLASQPRPTTLHELAALGLIDPLSPAQERAILTGETLFDQVGCTSCHVAQLEIADPIFYEPSQNPDYRDTLFPAGQQPTEWGVDPAFPLMVDLTKDQPDNQIETADGIVHLGSLTGNGQGGAVVALYGDLKRHDMGAALAEPIDDEGIPASVFLTENLWGVGSTAPYLHDGRATTLSEAILAHGGEGAASRANFVALSVDEQTNLVAFLNNLVLFKAP